MLTSTEPVIQTWAEGMEPFTRPRGQDVLRHLKARRRLLGSSLA